MSAAEKIQEKQTFPAKKPTSKKAFYTEEKTDFDTKTGEVQSSTKTTTSRTPAEPPYIKLYLDDIALLHNLPKGSSALMMQLLRQVNYEGLINLNSSVKSKIATSLGYKNRQSVDNGLNKLCKEQLIRSIDRGVYEVNPHLFGKGDWATIFLRRENFELTIYYDEQGKRHIKTDFDKEQAQKNGSETD